MKQIEEYEKIVLYLVGEYNKKFGVLLEDDTHTITILNSVGCIEKIPYHQVIKILKAGDIT